ncbi:cytoskeleton protein RodZ [Formivibrio citricus]|uniref:Cytoskeleton protein RodZ n=1 Tax=Formivibrio citricus TaxID=83765 RepID=A0A1I4XBG4_9NEIS|nr:RodZ domain-containing protein [Formivibrio citricus]SFN23125.1 cytoskeleton protein RodZ [Formivibrio citricus]
MTDISTQQDAEPAPLSSGAMLRAAREAKGLSVAEVAEKLKLSQRQIMALEADDFASLPGNTFIRGFVRNYARCLDLDPQLLLEQLAQTLPQERVQIAMPPVSEATAYEKGMEVGRTGSSWLVWVFVVLGVLAGVGGVFWYLQKPAAPEVAVSDATRFQERGSIESPVQSSAIPVASPVVPLQAASVPAADIPAPPALPASAPVEDKNTAAVTEATAGELIRVQTTESSSWVQVVDADGRVLIEQLVAPRGERSATGRPPLRIKIGNAPKTQLYYRGQRVDLEPHTRADVATLELK